MGDLERMRGELLNGIVKSTVGAVTDVIDKCRDDLPPELHRYLATFELIAGATPELIFKEVAPIIYDNRDEIRREDIDTIKKAVRAHVAMAIGDMNAVDQVFGFALDWWGGASAADRKHIKSRLLTVSEDYSEFLEEGLVI